VKIAIYGSSLLSSYWNGAATYYRGILRALAALGHDITFYEPDAFDRQRHRDMDPPEWCRVVVYPADPAGLAAALREGQGADVVMKASGVGYGDRELLEGVAGMAGAVVRIFWDVDAPATLAEIRPDPGHPLRRALGRLDLVLTYGGGRPVVDAYRGLGARDCIPVYNALDPATHHPAAAEARFAATLAFAGNRLPDREARVEEFFLRPAARLATARFLLAGAGWGDRAVPANVRALGHLPTADHNAFNASARAILNVTRDSMAATGFSPPTRVFEAAGAAACLMTDAWEGIEMFLKPGREVIVVRDGGDVVEALQQLRPAAARAIGRAARARILAEHTYDRRAQQLHLALTETLAARRAGDGIAA
jgi:spore maturation protein CgeB